MDSIYGDIASRTGGNVYIGVVGPVRTGKSTLIKRIMEQLVIPGIEDPFIRDSRTSYCSIPTTPTYTRSKPPPGSIKI